MKYNILPGIVKAQVCGETLLVAAGEARGKAPYVRNLNETAAFIWDMLEQDADDAAIIAALCSQYGIDEATAKLAKDSFIAQLAQEGYMRQE